MASQKKHKQNYMKVCLTNYSKNLKTSGSRSGKVASLTTNDKQLNAADRKFYNEINKNVGYKEETLIPEETIDRIFENLTTEHPLLSEIGLKMQD